MFYQVSTYIKNTMNRLSTYLIALRSITHKLYLLKSFCVTLKYNNISFSYYYDLP